jgi:acyl-CoA synthetase (AMP-forming)/AMP-acid ligase II
MVLPPDHRKKFGSIGKLLSNLEVRLVDDERNDVPEGEAGEVWVRGPTIMRVSMESSFLQNRPYFPVSQGLLK